MFEHLIELRVQITDFVRAFGLRADGIVLVDGDSEGSACKFIDRLRNRLLEPGPDDEGDKKRGEKRETEHQHEAFFATGDRSGIGFQVDDAGGMVVYLNALKHDNAVSHEAGLIAGC
ncbi:MAG TPA: hypothetical protein VJN21_02225 [Candidatus Acidoferrales bacterium]|nr:hypothetical protein [Candidatus Acidoferrales bacterium]